MLAICSLTDEEIRTMAKNSTMVVQNGTSKFVKDVTDEDCNVFKVALRNVRHSVTIESFVDVFVGQRYVGIIHFQNPNPKKKQSSEPVRISRVKTDRSRRFHAV